MTNCWDWIYLWPWSDINHTQNWWREKPPAPTPSIWPNIFQPQIDLTLVESSDSNEMVSGSIHEWVLFRWQHTLKHDSLHLEKVRSLQQTGGWGSSWITSPTTSTKETEGLATKSSGHGGSTLSFNPCLMNDRVRTDITCHNFCIWVNPVQIRHLWIGIHCHCCIEPNRLSSMRDPTQPWTRIDQLVKVIPGRDCMAKNLRGLTCRNPRNWKLGGQVSIQISVRLKSSFQEATVVKGHTLVDILHHVGFVGGIKGQEPTNHRNVISSANIRDFRGVTARSHGANGETNRPSDLPA